MLKTLGLVALMVVVASQTAYARHHRGDCCCSDVAAPAAAPADAPAAPAAPQARAPQSTRSYSYAPDAAGFSGSDRVNSLGNPVHLSFGLRSAASKANGNY